MQGVSYRASARDEAERLGVRGWVRNLPTGDVEAVAEAPPGTVQRFVQWCQHGPDEARVESVAVTDDASTDSLDGFRVTR